MEELEELHEALAEARAETERLSETLADREARLLSLGDELTAARQEAGRARGEVEQARAAAAVEGERLAARYREALLLGAPEVPPDLLQGSSVEELDRALAAARTVVARVREQVTAEHAARIPTGSPARGTPDAGGLSPGEKIRAGISERG